MSATRGADRCIRGEGDSRKLDKRGEKSDVPFCQFFSLFGQAPLRVVLRVERGNAHTHTSFTTRV